MKSRWGPPQDGKIAYRQWLFAKSDVCGICGARIRRYEDSTVDHIIPLFRGGPKTRENEQISHRDCNQFKGNLLMRDLPGLAVELRKFHGRLVRGAIIRTRHAA
jgi:hypothetical protein